MTFCLRRAYQISIKSQVSQNGLEVSMLKSNLAIIMIMIVQIYALGEIQIFVSSVLQPGAFNTCLKPGKISQQYLNRSKI